MKEAEMRMGIQMARNAAKQAEQAAKGLLVHYFMMALPGAEAGEIEDIATHIIEAAVMTAKAEAMTLRLAEETAAQRKKPAKRRGGAR